MAKKDIQNMIDKDWERCNNDTERKEFIISRILSYIQLFEFQRPGEITWDIYDDIDHLIKITTGSGILSKLKDSEKEQFKLLIEKRKSKPPAFSIHSTN